LDRARAADVQFHRSELRSLNQDSAPGMETFQEWLVQWLLDKFN